MAWFDAAVPGQCLRRLGQAFVSLLLLSLAACQTAPTATQPASEDCRTATASQATSPPDIYHLPPRPPGPSLALQGQLSVKLEAFGNQPARGLSLGFFFNGRASDGQMDLMTLMGSQVAQLKWSAGHAELTDSQGTHHYPSLAALSEAALGEALPLDTLVHWMQGRADPALPVQIGNEPDTFAQLGWLIDTRQLDEKKLSATRSPSPALRGARIKVYLDR